MSEAVSGHKRCFAMTRINGSVISCANKYKYYVPGTKFSFAFFAMTMLQKAAGTLISERRVMQVIRGQVHEAGFAASSL